MSLPVAQTVISTRTLPNGLVLVLEPMASVSSVGFSFLTPGGSAYDPADGQGQATMLAEHLLRGAGAFDSRAHSDALDRLGVQRSSSVSSHHIHVSATMLGSAVAEALPLLVSMLTEPRFDESALEPVRSLSLQALESLDDDPQHVSMLRLRERHLPVPFNRHGYGTPEGLAALTTQRLRKAWDVLARPRGSILGIAGAIDIDRVDELVSRLTERWAGSHSEAVSVAPAERGWAHLPDDSSQVHLGLAFDSPRDGDPLCAVERIGSWILGGGSSSRLFTEVRERRGLCYSVGASYQAGRDFGMTTIYAGSTPNRVQQTFDVIRAELDRFRHGVTEAEFNRAQVGLKSRVVMQGESTMARAMALTGDVFRRGFARSLEEIASEIDRVTLAEFNAALAARSFDVPTVVALGPVGVNPATG